MPLPWQGGRTLCGKACCCTIALSRIFGDCAIPKDQCWNCQHGQRHRSHSFHASVRFLPDVVHAQLSMQRIGRSVLVFWKCDCRQHLEGGHRSLQHSQIKKKAKCARFNSILTTDLMWCRPGSFTFQSMKGPDTGLAPLDCEKFWLSLVCQN
jgi:hypothetical protein